MGKNFIYTSDVDTANKLQLAGFQQVKVNSDNIYCFCNNTKFVFAETDIDTTKLKYSNILTF